jgi:hypothetical protein
LNACYMFRKSHPLSFYLFTSMRWCGNSSVGTAMG